MAKETEPVASRLPRGGMFILVVAGALLIRAIHLLMLRQTEFFQVLGLDAAHYDRWALQIVEGSGSDAPYFQGPLYPNFLAVLYRVFGHELLAVQLFQLFLGAITAGLVYAIGSLTATRRVGLGAAAIFALYPFAIFLDVQLIPATLLCFLATGALYAFLRGWSSGSWIACAVAGLLLGLAATGRATFLALGAVAIVLLGVSLLRNSDRARAIALAAFALGLTAALLPTTLHNLRASGEFVPISTNGGINYYIGNHDAASGLYQDVPGILFFQEGVPADGNSRAVASQRAGESLSHGESSRWWFSQGLEFNREQPGRTLVLYAQKLGYWLADYEIPQIENFDWAKRDVALFRLSPVRFGWIVALGAIGLIVGLRGGGPSRWIGVAVLGYSATVLPFFVTARFRVAMVPALCVLAALGFRLLLRGAPKMNRYALIGAAVVMLVLSFRIQPQGIQGSSDQLLPYTRGVRAMQNGDFASAANFFRQAVALDDHHVPSLANLAFCLDQTGADEEAIQYYALVLQLEPQNERILEPFARALIGAGQRDAAQPVLEELVRTQPENWWGFAALGDLARNAGDVPTALGHWEHILEHAPDGDYSRLARQRVAELRAGD